MYWRGRKGITKLIPPNLKQCLLKSLKKRLFPIGVYIFCSRLPLSLKLGVSLGCVSVASETSEGYACRDAFVSGFRWSQPSGGLSVPSACKQTALL